MRKPLTRSGVGLFSSKNSWSQTLSRITESKSRQFPRLRVSPNRILALRLRSNTEEHKSSYRGAFKIGANIRSGRLPILTLQTLLAKQDLSTEKALTTSLYNKNDAEWKDTLNSLATRGYSREHLDHWVWILSGEDGDARVTRLISTDDPKLIFLLLLLLRSDEIFRKPESLVSLIQYISKHHITHRPKPKPKPAATSSPMTDDVRTILTVAQFIILLRRLVHHVRRLWPQSIITVAHLAVNYIQSIPDDPHHKNHRKDYYDQCLVYNAALFSLRKPAFNEPLANMEFNWRAQKVLLTMSDILDKPLIINKASYRAIRQVLVGLKKSGEERAVALRYSKSWPPHQLEFDGRDAKRTIDEGRSRSVKAGILMKEAGYPENDYDRALDALGGASEGSPTIQTRSLPPVPSKDEREEANLYSNWAMNIRATRNAQEAWRVYNKFAEKRKISPNFQVYNEMFIKLQAAPARLDMASGLLPGDSRETFPVQDANYSEYELARLSPPTVAELYAEMINRGIKPRGQGLQTLVSHARTVEEGLRYLEDSGIASSVIRSIAPLSEPSHAVLRRIPLLSFSYYIQLLCRLQPDRRGRDRFFVDELNRIRHAIKLVSIRLTPTSTEGATFRPPWYAILRALARNHVTLKNATATENDLEALTLFMKVFQSARRCIGIDPELFILLCRVIQKAALSRLNSLALAQVEHEDEPLIPFAQELLGTTTSIFAELTTSVVEGDSTCLPIPQLQFPLTPPHLHSYMRALAFLEGKDAMVHLMIWMMDNHEQVNREAERLSGRGQAMIAKTLCCFHAFAGPALSSVEEEELSDRMDRLNTEGGFWRWPSPEDVQDYLNMDYRGGSVTLQRRIVARAYRDALREDKEEPKLAAAAAAP